MDEHKMRLAIEWAHRRPYDPAVIRRRLNLTPKTHVPGATPHEVLGWTLAGRRRDELARG
jgi:hypothetical protein